MLCLLTFTMELGSNGIPQVRSPGFSFRFEMNSHSTIPSICRVQKSSSSWISELNTKIVSIRMIVWHVHLIFLSHFQYQIQLTTWLAYKLFFSSFRWYEQVLLCLICCTSVAEMGASVLFQHTRIFISTDPS